MGATNAIAAPDARLRATLDDPSYRVIEGADHLGLPGHSVFRETVIAFLAAGALRDISPNTLQTATP